MAKDRGSEPGVSSQDGSAKDPKPSKVEACLAMLQSAKEMEDEEAVAFAQRRLEAARKERDAARSPLQARKKAELALQKAER